MGFGLAIEFIEHLNTQLVTTNNYSVITILILCILHVAVEECYQQTLFNLIQLLS
jgi:hypothetical protein